MKKIRRSLLLFSLFVIIVLQFFQPIENEGKVTADHLYRSSNVPASIHVMLDKACMDCHSNHTNYQWYHRISPVSWYVHNHIEEGKEELNFSEWGQLSTIDQLGKLEDIRKEVENDKMPLKSYRLIHTEARLSRDQIESLVAWIQTYQEKLVEEATSQ